MARKIDQKRLKFDLEMMQAIHTKFSGTSTSPIRAAGFTFEGYDHSRPYNVKYLEKLQNFVRCVDVMNGGQIEDDSEKQLTFDGNYIPGYISVTESYVEMDLHAKSLEREWKRSNEEYEKSMREIKEDSEVFMNEIEEEYGRLVEEAIEEEMQEKKKKARK